MSNEIPKTIKVRKPYTSDQYIEVPNPEYKAYCEEVASKALDEYVLAKYPIIMKFIQLTDDTGEKAYFNSAHILSVTKIKEDDDEFTVIQLVTENVFKVKETPEQVLNLINQP